jgi:hypothetical protein
VSAAPPAPSSACARGFRPGSSALEPDGSSSGRHRTTRVSLLPRADDRQGWHRVEEVATVAMRRARRIDLWLDHPAGRDVEIDAMFQDSSTSPGGGRVAVHEYRLCATTDADGGRILSRFRAGRVSASRPLRSSAPDGGA